MPSNYTGAVNNGAQSPSPQPGPGTVPVGSIPLGSDAPTIESISQDFKTLLDHTAYIQKSIALTPPNPISSNIGFTTVAHGGSGTGAVSVSGTNVSGLGFVIKILSTGSSTTATFAYSTDGGNTYSGTLTASSSGVALGSTGVTATFTGGAGAFVAGDTYSWQLTMNALARFADAGGVSRFSIDHNGFELSRFLKIDEAWRAGVATSSATTVANYPYYNFSRNGANHTYSIGAASDLPCLQITAASASVGNSASWYQNNASYFANVGSPNGTKMVAVFDWLVQPPTTPSDFYIGISDSAPSTAAFPSASSGASAYFKLAGGGSSWSTVVGNVTGGTTTVGSVATSTLGSSSWTRLRLEHHLPNSTLATAIGATTYGALLFWVNDNFAGVYTGSKVPGNLLMYMLMYAPVTTAGSTSFYLGPWSSRVSQGDFQSAM